MVAITYDIVILKSPGQLSCRISHILDLSDFLLTKLCVFLIISHQEIHSAVCSLIDHAKFSYIVKVVCVTCTLSFWFTISFLTKHLFLAKHENHTCQCLGWFLCQKNGKFPCALVTKLNLGLLTQAAQQSQSTDTTDCGEGKHNVDYKTPTRVWAASAQNTWTPKWSLGKGF